MMAEMIVLVVWLGIAAIAYHTGQSVGRRIGHEDTAGQCEMADRLVRAIDDLDHWCGHSSPHARLIAAHLTAHGLGKSLNSGTPHSDEPCTIDGLREQLRRLDVAAQQEPKP